MGRVTGTVEDERVAAWEAVARHPALRGCYQEGRPLLPAVLDYLTYLAAVERQAAATATASLVADHEQMLRALTAARYGRSLSREAVAARIGVDLEEVVRFERRGADPTLSTVRRYALAVGVEISTGVTGAGGAS